MAFWKSLPGRWRRFGQLSWSDRFRLMQMLLMLPALSSALRLRGYKGVWSWIQRSRANGGFTTGPEVDELIDTDTALVEAAARVWNANCLQRSLALSWVLGRQGIDTELLLGTGRGSDGELRFHAWLEHGGRVINDSENIRDEFQVFEPRVVPPEAEFD